MRLLAFPIVLFAVVALSEAPASAYTVSETVTVSNAGPVNNCPVTINLVATVHLTNWTLVPNQQLQYKWSNSGGGDMPTQSSLIPGLAPTAKPTATPSGSTNGLNLGIGSSPTTGAAPSSSSSDVEMILRTTRVVSAGTYWSALQVSYPFNQGSPQTTYVVTCPTLGSITLPLTTSIDQSRSPIITSPPRP